MDDGIKTGQQKLGCRRLGMAISEGNQFGVFSEKFSSGQTFSEYFGSERTRIASKLPS
jgi:hypothetical protein